MAGCPACRASREVPLPRDVPSSVEAWPLRDLQAQGLFRCRICNSGAATLHVRARAIGRGEVTIEGWPASAFGQLATMAELDPMHDDKKGPGDESARAS